MLGIAALAVTLFIVQPSQAQHGHSRGGGGGHGAAHVSAPRSGGHVSAPRPAAHVNTSHAVVHSNAGHAVVHSGATPAAIQHGVGTAHVNAGPNHVNAFKAGNVPNHAFASHGTFNGATAGGTWAGRNGAWNGGRGWNGGWNGWNGGWNGGWGNRNFFGFWFNPFGLFGWTGGFWPYPYFDYGYPYAAYDYGSAVVPPAAYYGDFATAPYTAAQPTADLSGHIDVVVPSANAALWFNGYQATTSGDTRHFDTPALRPGQDYTYTIKAAWFTPDGQPVSQERVVRVIAGARAVVDFTQMPPLQNGIQQ